MYTSLGRIDIIVDDKGRKLAVQTDHRAIDEIEATWAISAVFAAARARNPVISKAADAVRFAMIQGGSDRYVTLVTQLGAEVEHGVGGRITPAALDLEAARATLEAAVLELGAATLAEAGLAPDLAGIEVLEVAVRDAQVLPPDEDETGFWTGVVQLGAALAFTLQRAHGGRLNLEDEIAGMIPMRWGFDTALINVFGRPEEYLSHDPTYLPSKLVVLAAERAVAGVDEGEVLFSLKAGGWPGRGVALTEPLLEMNEGDPTDFPLVVLVHDLPNTTSTIPHDTAPEEVARLRVLAHENLQRVAVEVGEVDAPGGNLIVVNGHYYAAEKILDPDFLRAQARRLGAEVLLAGVPRRGMLLLRNGIGDAATSIAFTRIVRGQYDEAAPQERIATGVFLIVDGKVAGVARVTEDTPPPAPKKSLWARLFGR